MTTAIEQTYEDVEDLIHHVVHRFLKKKGISEYEYDEWHGEACRAFASSYTTFDPMVARFTTHLWTRIWYALSDKLRSDAPHWRTVHYDYSDEEIERLPDESSTESRLEEIVSSLSEDAATVVRLVIGAGGLVEERESKPEEIRLGLYSLLTNFGWSFRRIVETFHEIRVVLLEGD